MAYSRKRTYHRHRTSVYRSARDRVFAGVCGGLGDHFDVSANWLRAGFIVGTIFTFPVVPILYVVCILVMPQAFGAAPRQHRPEPVRPTFVNREEAVKHLDHQFDDIEARIRMLEDHVTSREYVLKRKFDEL